MHNNSDRSCLELLRGEFLYSGRLGQPTPDGRVRHLCRHLKGIADVSRPPLWVVRCRKVTTSILETSATTDPNDGQGKETQKADGDHLPHALVSGFLIQVWNSGLF